MYMMYMGYDVGYSDLPPPYSTLPPNCPKYTDPPTSYSSLDLTDLPPLETPTAETISAAGPHRPQAETTVPTRQTGFQVPTYLLWSIISTLLFFPLGFVALIFSLKVRIAMQNNDAGSAWKSHVLAWRINKVATIVGAMLLFYYGFTIPLMFQSKNNPFTDTTPTSP